MTQRVGQHITRFEYRGLGNAPSACELEVTHHLDRGLSVVVATDIGEGTSVTNFAEQLATLVVERYGIDPTRLIWLEHYQADRYEGAEETWDLVSFTWHGKVASSPKWKHLSTYPPRLSTVLAHGTVIDAPAARRLEG